MSLPTISTWNLCRGGRAFLSGRPRPTSVAKGGWLGGAPSSPGAPTKLRILDKHNPLWRRSALPVPALGRSEERRVGKEWVSTGRSRWSRYNKQKNHRKSRIRQIKNN